MCERNIDACAYVRTYGHYIPAAEKKKITLGEHNIVYTYNCERPTLVSTMEREKKEGEYTRERERERESDKEKEKEKIYNNNNVRRHHPYKFENLFNRIFFLEIYLRENICRPLST